MRSRLRCCLPAVWIQQKNLGRVLEAAALLRQRGQDFQLLIAGTGPEEKNARTLARELGILGTVRFLGQITDEALLGELYAESALCLFPCSASARGLLCARGGAGHALARHRGQLAGRAITDGVNGLTCRDNAESMAQAGTELSLTDPAAQQGMRQPRDGAVAWDAVISA